jgi:Predicted membrane protein (DUF2306)
MIIFNYLRSCAFPVSLLTLGLSILIAYNSLIYFVSPDNTAFLIEKGNIAADAIWWTSFFSHVVSACACLVIGGLLMFPSMLRFRSLHRWLGYGYFNTVLWVAGPTGGVLAFSAKGGWPSTLGFLLTGIVWWWSTWMGYIKIRAGHVDEHIRWVIRSYSESIRKLQLT